MESAQIPMEEAMETAKIPEDVRGPVIEYIQKNRWNEKPPGLYREHDTILAVSIGAINQVNFRCNQSAPSGI